MQKRVDTIHQTDSAIQNELRLLGRATPIHWFNPGFQSAAKKHAMEMANHFNELATGCNLLVEYLTPLRFDLKEQLASIPNR